MTKATERPETPGVVLAACGSDTVWLLEGEEHMAALLSNAPGYPTPAVRLQFTDADAFTGFLSPHGMTPQSLWAIHPNIIARMEEADEIRDVPMDAPKAEV